jgi:ABC-type dipeptide/oligopeptide/nickel transport system permease subunit
MTDTTEHMPAGDKRAQDAETIPLSSESVGRPAAAGSRPGAMAGMEEPLGVAEPDLSLAYESGVELKARSQWAYARIRFFRHRLALGSLLVLVLIGVVALLPGTFAPYGYDEIPFTDPQKIIENPNIVQDSINQAPTTKEWHLFGTDQLGRDNLSRVIFGMRTSLWVALFVALLSTAVGTAIGAAAGYYGGVVDNLLMRLTDLILTLPGLAVLLTAAAFFGQSAKEINLGLFSVTLPQTLVVGLILAFLFWTGIARIVRGVFLSLREKEYVEAAKASGASDLRIIVRHMLPNTVGPIVVNATLVVATAILVEAALSFLGFGIQPPNPALGSLIQSGLAEGNKLWWLVTFPGIVIVIIALAINFVGDGLRDALDPTQRRVRA